MDIVIPTYRRPQQNLQHTYRQLREAGVSVKLVVQTSEYRAYSWADSRAVLPEHITTIAPTRDWIIHDMPGDDKVLMLDDDLQFAVRRDDDPTKFRQPHPSDVVTMIDTISAYLDRGPMVGIGAREGGNRNIEPIMWNTRTMRVLGFRRDILKKKLVCCHPMEVMEDFHVSLQLLRLGYDIPLLNTWVSNQAGGSGASGGCSAWRTTALQTANAHRLAGLHPGYVKVVQKAANTAWGGEPRTDVTVYWKKARASHV